MSIYLDIHYGLLVWKNEIYAFFRDNIIKKLTLAIDEFSKKIDTLDEHIKKFEKLVQSEEVRKTLNEYWSQFYHILPSLRIRQDLLKFFTKGDWTIDLPQLEFTDLYRFILRKIGQEIGLDFHKHGSGFVLGLPMKINGEVSLSKLSIILNGKTYLDLKEKVKEKLREIGIVQERNPSLKDLTAWTVREYSLDSHTETKIPVEIEEYLKIPQFKASDLDFFLDATKC